MFRRRGPRIAVLLAIAVAAASLPACKKKPPTAPTIPDYAGTWTGMYTVTTCSNTGLFQQAGFCAQLLNTAAQVTFTFAQDDRAVSGSFQLGSLAFPNVNTSVADDDSVTLSSTLADPAFPIEASWTVRQQASGTLTGTTHQVWKATGQNGEGVVDGQLTSATR